jgi:protein-disulfide isomerase
VKRDRRLLLLLIAIAVAAVVVVGIVVAVAVGGGDDSSSGASTTTTASGATSRSAKVMGGIPQQGMTLGKAGAPATLVEFADLQCPYCMHFANQALPTVVRKYVRTGKLKLRYNGMAFLGDDSQTALRAVVAASQQNRAWNMIEELFARQGAENSGWVTDEVLKEAAAAAGVDYDKMKAAMDSQQVSAIVEDDAMEASRIGVNQTPTFVLIRPPNQPQMLDVKSFEPADFAATLSAALGT